MKIKNVAYVLLIATKVDYITTNQPVLAKELVQNK